MRADVLTRLVAGHVCLHACMAGTRMAAPLLALRQGYSPLAVGVLLALSHSRKCSWRYLPDGSRIATV